MNTDFLEKKIKDAIPLRNFVNSISTKRLTEILDELELRGIRRTTYGNWRNGNCAISDEHKRIFEEIAETKIWE